MEINAQNYLNGIIHALRQYWAVGAETTVLNVDNSDQSKQIALGLSNYIEAQDSGYLILNVTTDDSEPDLSWLATIAPNRATKPVSLPIANDPDHVFGSSVLGAYTAKSIGANMKYVQNLVGVTPQDKYTFGYDQLQNYEKYNVGTYVYDPDTPTLSNGKSLSGVDASVYYVKDAIRNQITDRANQFIKNNDATPYDQASINQLNAIASGVLETSKSNRLIADYKLDPPVNVNNVPDEIKAKGIFTGTNWKIKPMYSINEGWLTQNLVLTENE